MEGQTTLTLVVFRCQNETLLKFVQIYFSHEKSAVIEFVSPNSAELFQRTHNRKMMDLAIITVTRYY